jgi:hypothetical protein
VAGVAVVAATVTRAGAHIVATDRSVHGTAVVPMLRHDAGT